MCVGRKLATTIATQNRNWSVKRSVRDRNKGYMEWNGDREIEREGERGDRDREGGRDGRQRYRGRDTLGSEGGREGRQRGRDTVGRE